MNTKKTHFWIIVMWVITACVTTRYSNEATDESDPLSKVRPLLAQPVQITVGNDANLTPDLSSDGQRLVYTTSINGNKEIILRDRRKNTQARLTWHAADDFAPVLSPDGTQVAFLTRRQDAAGDVAVMPTGGFTTSLLSERSLDVYSKTDTEELAPAWWPDGKHLLVPSRNTKARSPLLMRLNIESHEWLPWADRHGEFPEIAPGGNIIAYVRDGKIYLNSETGNSEKQLDVPTQGVWSRPRFVRPISKVESVQDDVQDLVAVRYQHDTNRDGRVDGGDAGVVWRIQFSPLSLKVLHTEQLTAATHNAFAPDLKQEGLFVTLQAKGALEIFKFPAIGQSRKEWVSLPESRWLNAMDNIYDRVFALNNTAARFESNNDGLAAITLRLRGIRELADKGLSLDVKIATSDLRAHYNADKTVEAVARCLDLFSDSIQDLVTLQAGKAGLSDRSRIEKVLKTLKTIREEFTYLPRGIMSRDDSSGFVSILIATIAQRSRDSSAARSELSRISKSVGARIRDEAKLVEAEVDGDLSGSIALESKLKLLLKEQIASPDVLRRAADRFIQSIENRHPDNEELAGLRQEISTLPFLPPLIHELVAKRFMTEKKHMVAVQEYRQILEDHCRDHGTVTIQLAKTYVDVAMTYGNTEEIDKSLGLLADCTKAQEADRIEVKVLRAQALVRRGVGLLREREFAVALKVFKEATVIDPENLGGWRGFIDALFQRKALSGEISALEQNFIKNQGSASATYAYGYALTYEIDIASSATAKISAIDDALQVIETAKDLNPSSIYPYQTLGWLHMQKGHWIKRQRAEGGLRGSTSALIAKTRALFGRPEQDQIELGVDSFLAAIYLAEDKSLERANLLQNLGEAYHELENHQKALLNLSERLSLAKSQPFSDRNSEASIYRLAGRSAFQTDELNLAESLQRKGLELWQAGGNDQQISYSMDALALTLREEGKFSESIVVYNDLRIRHLAAKRKMELYRTISNIGYCQFMNNDLDAALESFQSSDRGFMGTDLSKIATERGSAIELDVGGQASAAKGFDSTGLRNMNLTFTARIYDKLHRFGQSAEVYRQKIALLQSSVKEANSLSSAANQEEIIITRNNLGLALLNAGQLGEARNEYRTASIEAKALRTSEGASADEAINLAIWARLELRLLALGVTAGATQGEVLLRINEISALVAVEQAKPTGKAKWEQLGGRLKLIKAYLETAQIKDSTQTSETVRRLLDTVSEWPEDSFGNGTRKFEYAWAGFATASKPLKGPLKKSMRDLRRLGLAVGEKPESWLYFSASAQHKEAIKQIETQVMRGHVIGNILEDQVLFHTIESAVEESVHETEKIDYLRTLGRIKLVSYTNATTSNDKPNVELSNETHNFLKSATDENLGESIRNGDGILITLNIGLKWHVGFFSKHKWHFQTLGSVSDVVNFALDAKDRLYFTCYGSECENLRIGLGDGLRRLSIIASPDQIPDFFQMRKLAKSTLTIASDRNSADEAHLQNQFTNIDANFVIGPSWESVKKSAGSAHILVMNTQLKVGHDKPWNASFSFNDSNVWPLRDAQLGSPWHNTALVFPHLSAIESNLDPMTVYTYLSVWLQLQRVPMALIGPVKGTAKEAVKETVKETQSPPPPPSSVTNPPKASPLGATVAAPSKQVEKLTLDLQKILHGNTAEAINGYVRIGDSGLLESEALDFANQHLEIAKNNAQDAREDKLFPEAKRFFMEALHYAEILKLPSEALSINDSLVKTLFQARDYQSALHFQNRRVRMLTSAGAKEEDIAAAEMEAGILATRAGIGSIARQHLRAAETFYQKDQDEEKLPQIYHYIGLSYEGEGEFQKTIESYEQSRSLSDKVGRKIDAAQKLLDIGNIYKERLSNLPLALDFYGKAFEAFEKLGQQDRLISVQIDRANTLMAIGETKWAINVIERRVLNAIEPATNPGLWIRSAQIVANAYYRAGMFEESQAYITKIRATIPDLKDETSRANASIDCDNLWAMNSEKLGNHGDASVVFDQSLKLARKFKLRGKESMILNNIGFWAREAGDVAQSLTYFEQALAIDKDLKSEADQAYDLRNMAMSWTMLGNLIQASSAAQQALDASSRLKLAHNEAYSLFALAEIQMKKSAPAEAVKLFQRAKEVAVKAYLQDFVWRADAAIANVEMGMKNLDKAAIAYANSVTIIESMRAGLSSQSSKTGFASDRGVQDVYAGIVRVLMKLGRIEEAWVYSERGRARSFIDALGSKAQTFGDAALDQAMEEERRLRSDEEVLERRLATTPEKSAESVIVKAALAKANADRKIKITEVTTKWPRVTPFIGVQKMDLSIVKGRLNQETAILEFMCLDEETAYWVIQNGVIHGGLLTIKRKELNDKISQYRELMQNFAAVKATARDLTEILLKEPLKHLQSTKELIIVPHGELHYLPFASLPVQDHFLLDQFSVSYLESAEMLRFSSISARKIFNGSKLIAFGNPDRGPELNLPFAEREVHALGRSFKNSKSIFGKDASEKNFVTMIRDVDIVHFAGHGEFNESDAAASRLLFAKSDDLTVKEMLTLQMPVSLVTLSACETGLGKLSSGDEMVGFNRALFFSGAASVVSSLWRVSDVASSVTIKRFYSELAKGTPKAEALRKAQIVVRKYYNHPAYWSAFKLSGER